MTNFAFEKAMAKLGIGFGRAKVGDRYVLEMMREKGCELKVDSNDRARRLPLPDYGGMMVGPTLEEEGT